MRQFGVMIPAHVNAGIGGSLRYSPDSEIGILYPNHFLEDDEEDFTIAGLTPNLIETVFFGMSVHKGSLFISFCPCYFIFQSKFLM